MLALDESGVVIDRVRSLRPWRIRLPRRGTAGVLELAAGTVDKSGTELGHRILFEIVEDSPVHGSTSSPVPGSNGHADERRTVNL
ncbi:MAG: hypothetical protein DMF86_02600 [Acidobacteria bacterium]|nr:MAG: hypothetical protein DMF86_02600 [Acidobacteriota bacterium]